MSNIYKVDVRVCLDAHCYLEIISPTTKKSIKISIPIDYLEYTGRFYDEVTGHWFPLFIINEQRCRYDVEVPANYVGFTDEQDYYEFGKIKRNSIGLIFSILYRIAILPGSKNQKYLRIDPQVCNNYINNPLTKSELDSKYNKLYNEAKRKSIPLNCIPDSYVDYLSTIELSLEESINLAKIYRDQNDNILSVINEYDNIIKDNYEVKAKAKIEKN